MMNSSTCLININERHFIETFGKTQYFSEQRNSNYSTFRTYCTDAERDLTHVDNSGKAVMVDVSQKSITFRSATAQAIVKVGPVIADLIEKNCLKKGDVFTVAQLAGIMGAKKTSDLIPLCHNIALSKVNVNVTLNKETNSVIIIATVHCQGKTGVEMEALTAATVSALTVYDMCKAVSHNIIISEVLLKEKMGGKRDFHRNP